MLFYGHRGASAEEPENTLRAFTRAIELGVDGIELDLQATADRVPVVMHDRDLRRTTNGQGPIDRLTLAHVRAIDAGHGERIPTLDDVLRLVGDRVHLDLEIKQGGIEAEIMADLARYPSVRWAVSSFDWTSLERVRALSVSAELWVLAVCASDAVLNIAQRLCATTIALWDSAYTPAAAERLRSAGLQTVIWTVNDPKRAQTLRALGAAGICTDDPARLRSK